MSKDVNIHVKTTGTDQTKQQLDEVSKSAQGIGQKTAEGQDQAANAIDKSTQKLSGLGSILSGLKTSVIGFIASWIGIQKVIEALGDWIRKLERIQQLQQQIYEKSLSFMDVGQRLELQTGTKGKQQYWAQLATEITAAGGLPEGVAGPMLLSMDTTFAAQGGIKNKQIQNLAKQLAPFIGAAGFGPGEVDKIFEFAGTAGITPTAQAYKQYFAQLQAAFKSSKTTNFGEFMVGLQKGGTAYMAMGGTLTEALSTYSGARAVVANDELAATLVEQVARLSAGGYEKPRTAIEKKLGVKWSQLTMDQRTAALLQYVGGIPESNRVETLVAQGFRPELAMQIGKMITPEAVGTMAATRDAVSAATTTTVDEQTEAYLNSILGKSKVEEGKRAGKQLKAGPAFASWQERLKTARNDFDILVAKGKDRWIPDIIEPYVMAQESIVKDLDTLLAQVPEEKAGDIRKLRADLVESIWWQSHFPSAPLATGYTQQTGYEYSRAVQTLEIHYHNEMVFNPVGGTKLDRQIGGRFEPPY